jgi:transposase-like protein
LVLARLVRLVPGMTCTDAPSAPPFCPNPACRFHLKPSPAWRFRRDGFYTRSRGPRRVQRYRCVTCRRRFGDQTFRSTYWLKRPDLQRPIFHGLVSCAGYRQLARAFGVSPQTILTHAARLGRHCMLFHERHRPHGPLAEPVALDTFVSFEFSQDHPVGFHVVAGTASHFFYGFTDSEHRRSGRMTPRQRRRRARLERLLGRPDPRAGEKAVRDVLAVVAPQPQALTLHTDEHADYPRALRRLRHLRVDHRTISSRAARTTRNPLFPINLLDLLLRHSGANHKRETIAFSKRRQSAVERKWVFLVWRNYVKAFSEREQDASPAVRLGLFPRRLEVQEVLRQRHFPTRIPLPGVWARYYRRGVLTRRIGRNATHRARYAN